MNKPSFLQMMKNFATETARYIKQGAPNVTEAEYASRVQECDACPHLEREHMRCGLCGCTIENKAKWQTADCPDNRWAKHTDRNGRKNTDSKIVNEIQSPDTDN